MLADGRLSLALVVALGLVRAAEEPAACATPANGVTVSDVTTLLLLLLLLLHEASDKTLILLLGKT